MEMYKLIMEILDEIANHESNVKVAGGRGYSTGKVYPNNTVGVLKLLGKEENEEENEEEFNKTVQVSKIFKKEKK